MEGAETGGEGVEGDTCLLTPGPLSLGHVWCPSTATPVRLTAVD